ncbi:asparagine synthetase B family protein [Prochlorothrix hollandica]|uniref:asparagine synthase (glutamine-hydrolyzing) n=1 Tax=Prochlorothrix hollandica PCC 9006 = CALU 1027 TaxID=317619 RepID=A0A0M2PV32_PROHO|nr:hypothetical protein [Prochlorothrix hollandica]KKI98513.1 hypothetical protein PROH_19085 [Prochlorothrix hollandica PCC 9006 = CALU 1027]
MIFSNNLIHILGHYTSENKDSLTNLLNTQYSDNNKFFKSFFQLKNLVLSLASRNTIETEPRNFSHQDWYIWLIGEVYQCNAIGFDAKNSNCLDHQDFGHFLIDKICSPRNWKALQEIDGQFICVFYSRSEEALYIVNDRFGGIPLYYSVASNQFFFSTSLNSIATLPNFNYQPDEEALKESINFGGFRLGDRTGVAGIKILPWASVLEFKLESPPRLIRYWNPQDTQRQNLSNNLEDLVEEAYHLWQLAIVRRVVDLKIPGQTLSGGLDSRAILAEVHERFPQWTGISFGVPNCDDVRYAFQASQATAIRYICHPMYYGFSEYWFEKRLGYVWESDGMVDFSNLLHWETLPLQEMLFDGHISGFIGDVIGGGSWDEVKDVKSFLNRLPFYDTNLGIDSAKAKEGVDSILKNTTDRKIKYVFYEAKVSQQTNLLFQAPYNRIKVRKPFVDYQLFDFFESLSDEVRKLLYPTMLKSKYPSLYQHIPNQKTGMPILTPSWKLNIERARRLIYRKTQPSLKKLGFNCEPRARLFLDDYKAVNIGDTKHKIRELLLSNDSIVKEVLDQERLEKFISAWLDFGNAPTNAIGAMISFEVFHQEIKKRRLNY